MRAGGQTLALLTAPVIPWRESLSTKSPLVSQTTSSAVSGLLAMKLEGDRIALKTMRKVTAKVAQTPSLFLAGFMALPTML